jgi:hypothetical protein
MLMLSDIGSPAPLHNLRHDPRLLLLLGFAADVFEHIVHLLQCPPGRLGNAEEGEDKRNKTEDREEDVGSCPGVLNQGWCNETLLPTLISQCNARRMRTTYDDEVVEPVRARRERDALGS